MQLNQHYYATTTSTKISDYRKSNRKLPFEACSMIFSHPSKSLSITWSKIVQQKQKKLQFQFTSNS